MGLVRPGPASDQGCSTLRNGEAIIARSLWPNLTRNQLPSDGLAELMVFYCEQAAGFDGEYGFEEGGYFDALVRMFAQALEASVTLPAEQCDTMLHRLASVRRIGHRLATGLDTTWTICSRDTPDRARRPNERVVQVGGTALQHYGQ